MSLKQDLAGRSPLAFGVSGALSTHLVPMGALQHLVETALEGGVSIFDTAPAYGDGMAERRLGRAVAGRDAFISTKAGLYASGLRRRIRDFSPDRIEQSAEASLERLQRPIDLLWLHGAAPEELTPALIDRLARMQADGRVRHLGLAGRGEELESGLDKGPFCAVMHPIHAGLGESVVQRIAQFSAKGAVVFAIEVMAPVARQGGGLSAGALWRAGRRALRGGPVTPDSAGLSAADALHWARNKARADVIVTTTTRLDRLKENLHVAGRAPPTIESNRMDS